MSDDQLLDAVITAENDLSPESADLGSRFGNAFIDGIALRILSYVVSFAVAGFSPVGAIFLSLLLNLAYFIVLEAAFGQTLGKMITGTIVVNELGERPTLGQIVIRLLVRIIPLFDALSFFFYKDQRGWHDRWSNTYVIKKNRL